MITAAKTSREKLLDKIETFLLRHDMTAARFGRESMGDTRFVHRMRDGGGCGLDTADHLERFMASYGAPRRPKQRPREAAA